MSNYFDQVEQSLCEAVERRARRPWYKRGFGLKRTRTLAVVLAALVVAAPAVGAVTNWFGTGVPNRIPSQSPTQNAGRALSPTSELLSLRVPDPQGGPPWGLRLVRTTRGATCLQLGRVEDGQVGSLGIDDAWHNDRLFHRFPVTSEGDGFDCGTTDGAGHAFFEAAYIGMAASAAAAGGTGSETEGCHYDASSPPCPPGSTRIIFMGLLGPDATSVTYEAPSGRLETERTSGEDGAYLLVFTRDSATCHLYEDSDLTLIRDPGCATAGSDAGGSMLGSAVVSVRYRDGQVCKLGLSPTVEARYATFMKRELSALNVGGGVPNPSERARLQKAQTIFFTSQHLTLASYRDELFHLCPAVGYVSPHARRITAVMVATPITVKLLHKSQGTELAISFVARQPVTSGSSWYEDQVTTPPGCATRGFSSEVGFGDVRVGQVLHHDSYLPPFSGCTGVYHGVVGYMQDSGPIGAVGEGAGGGTPGEDGSVVVRRFSFRVR